MSTRRNLHDHDSGEGLVSVEDARARILSRVTTMTPAELPLRDAFGCVQAEDAFASNDIPAFASSAMDGFAFRARDVNAATLDRPATLAITGEVFMGRPPGIRVPQGGAVRIPTGGVVPEGADSIVPIEHCVLEGARVLILRPPEKGRFIRAAGEDARRGELLVPVGRRLLAPDLGLLAASARGATRVIPRARVAVVSTGDELVEAGADVAEGQIPDANSVTLNAALLDAGAEPQPPIIVPDDPDEFRAALTAAGESADVLIASGGVSVGDRDPVRGAFLGSGEVEFYGVAMQPGMPQAFGLVEGKPFFGLPGNPVSVFVSFEVFVRPALLKMMGRRSLFRQEVTARLEAAIAGPREKTQYAGVIAREGPDGWTAASTGSRQSNLIGTASRANGLAIIPAGVAGLGAGDSCAVMLFRDSED
jgi:molybdopterin molybdotransferase